MLPLAGDAYTKEVIPRTLPEPLRALSRSRSLTSLPIGQEIQPQIRRVPFLPISGTNIKRAPPSPQTSIFPRRKHRVIPAAQVTSFQLQFLVIAFVFWSFQRALLLVTIFVHLANIFVMFALHFLLFIQMALNVSSYESTALIIIQN